jgi:transglutaminase-like putative cysteine protease
MDEQMKLDKVWISLFLVWSMVFVSAMAIVQADWIDGLFVIPIVATLGFVAGIFLASSEFSARRAHIFSLMYGLFVIFYFCGLLLPDDLTWRERIFDLVSRQMVWLGQAFGQGTSRDGFIFVIQTTMVYWVLGYTSAWFTTRYRFLWRSVFPTGIVLFSVVYYYVGPKIAQMSLYLAGYSLLAFMYIAYSYLIDQEEKWHKKKVRYRADIRISFLRSSLLVALAALIVAWSLPTMPASAAVNDALSGTRGPWRSVQDNWTRLFSSLRSYGSAVNDPYQDTLALGGPRTVGNSLVMDVYVPEKLPLVYWQAVVYDSYIDGRWRVGDDDTFLHPENGGRLDVPLTASREVVTQTVINFLPNSSILYAAPQPVQSNREMYVTAGQDDNGRFLINSMRSRFILRQGDQYRMYSQMSTADVYSLRHASLDYPEWVVSRYLQLPDSITPQTADLAERLTAVYENPYDKAIAVRDYLRSNISYNDQIDAPPPNEEPLHYFLFVSQEGYCNYYAAAMVIMLRSQGIPARFVTGYAQGEWDEATRSYRVRANHAHTWVEVYFPTYGWIQFEPTTAIPVVSRPELPPGGLPEDGDEFSTPSISPQGDRGLEDTILMDDFFPEEGATASSFDLEGEETRVVSLWQILGALLIVGTAVGLVVTANNYNVRIESDVSLSYDRLSRWGNWLGLPFGSTQTPHERAEVMVQKVPEGEWSIWKLTQQYVLKMFSRSHTGDETFDSRKEWQKLRPLLLRSTMKTQWQQWWQRWRRTEEQGD